MSDYIAAEILIGGKIRKKLATRLCQVIADQHVSLAWGDGHFTPQTVEDLLAARRDIQDAQVLWMCDHEARWGEFRQLEEFLTENRIAFRRQSDAKCEHDAERVDYRPGHRIVATMTNSDQVPVTELSTLREIRSAMEQAAQLIDGGKVDTTRRLLRKVLNSMRKDFPDELPPLTSLEIV